MRAAREKLRMHYPLKARKILLPGKIFAARVCSGPRKDYLVFGFLTEGKQHQTRSKYYKLTYTKLKDDKAKTGPIKMLGPVAIIP